MYRWILTLTAPKTPRLKLVAFDAARYPDDAKAFAEYVTAVSAAKSTACWPPTPAY